MFFVALGGAFTFNELSHTVKVGFHFAKIKPEILQSRTKLEITKFVFFFVRFLFRLIKSDIPTEIFVLRSKIRFSSVCKLTGRGISL